MATVVSQHVRHFGRHLGFFKNFILRKIAASFIEISRKHVFPASNRIRIENRKTRTNFPKNLQFSISNFNLHNWLCINYNWWRHSINVTRCAHLYQTTDTESFILIAWELQNLDRKNLWGGGVHFTTPLDVRELMAAELPTAKTVYIWYRVHSGVNSDVCAKFFTFVRWFNHRRNPVWDYMPEGLDSKLWPSGAAPKSYR